MNNIKAKWFSPLFIIPLLGILYYYLFRGRSENVKYGKPADVIRENVKVPIIGSDMKQIRLPDNVGGGRWEGEDKENGLVHLWKIVSPHNRGYLLDKESDSFKKYKGRETYWQLNVYSKIFGDTVSIREGRLWLRCNGCTDSEQPLNENGLDSIFTEWGLKDLVKKDGI
jgi:hypothetical protein